MNYTINSSASTFLVSEFFENLFITVAQAPKELNPASPRVKPVDKKTRQRIRAQNRPSEKPEKQMSTAELKNRLIEKIQNTQDERILEEAFRLLDLENEDIKVYKLNDAQKKTISEAREQINNGQFFTEEAANKEIDEWLNE